MLGSKEVHHLLVTISDNVLHRTDNLCRQFHLTVLKIFNIRDLAGTVGVASPEILRLCCSRPARS